MAGRRKFLSEEDISPTVTELTTEEQDVAAINEDGDVVIPDYQSTIISEPELSKFTEPNDLLENIPPVDILLETTSPVNQMDIMVPIDIDMSTDSVYIIPDDGYDDEPILITGTRISQSAVDDDNKYLAHKAPELPETEPPVDSTAKTESKPYEPIRFSSASANIIKREKLTSASKKTEEVSLSLFKKELKDFEYEVGQIPEGIDSYSPEWAFECEVRQISMMNAAQRDAFIGGISKARGPEFGERLKAEVESRMRLMNKLSIAHPRIDVKKAIQAIEKNEINGSEELYIKPRDVNRKGRRL